MFFEVPQRESAQTIIYGLSSAIDDTLPKNVNECTLDLTERNSFIDFWAIVDKDIYLKLDTECDVIKIRTNELFLDLIEKSAFAPILLPVANRKFKYPFGQILNRVLQPSILLKHKLTHLVKTFFGRPWMSIHSRGKLDPDGKLTVRAIDCANHLLKKGEIEFIFFSSESERLTDIVEENIKPLSAYISIEKKFENVSITSHTQFVEHGTTALEEWYLMGEATYCTTVTPKSMFSSTALMRTGCKYIPSTLHAGNCTVEHQIFHVKPKNMLVFEQPKDGKNNSINVDKFWQVIPQKKVAINFAPVLKTTVKEIRKFWEAPQTPPFEQNL